MSCLLNVLAIKYDRFLGICFPMNTYTKWRATSMKTILMTIWILACALGMPEVLNFQLFGVDNTRITSSICFTSFNKTFQRVYQCILSCLFLLALLVSLYCLVRMTVVLSQQNVRRKELRGHKKTITLLFTVITTFGICLLPYHVLQILISADPDTFIYKFGLTRFSIVFEVLQMLTFLNCALNPVIYNFTSSKFNVAF